MMKDIRLAIRTLLLADPAVNSLVGGKRIYPVQLLEGVRDPSIVFGRITDISDYHMLGDSGLQQTFMQINAFANKHDLSVNLADATHDAISGFRGTVIYDAGSSPPGFIEVQGIFHIGGRDLHDDTVQLFNMSRDYQIAFADR